MEEGEEGGEGGERKIDVKLKGREGVWRGERMAEENE